jgi:hypothetical protein
MLQTADLQTYLAAELENERCSLIPQLAACLDAEASLFNIWSVLSMLPTRKERVQVASSLLVTARPSGTWAACSYLMLDSEQDVVGQAINAMTRSKVRTFAHRAFHYFKSPERPQRILYCLARYCEEAGDARISEQLASTLASDLSDAYLARSLNALYRHGIKNDLALQVSMELVKSHIDATNMDRKAAVAAITYLFFAGSSSHLDELLKIQGRITIPELRRLLNWGFTEIAHLCDNGELNLTTLSELRFWKINLHSSHPNFSGFGCFSSKKLLHGLQTADRENLLPLKTQLTERILLLGVPECVEWLATHEAYGILEPEKIDQETIKYWKNISSNKSKSFLDSVLSTANAEIWHSESPELLAVNLAGKSIDDFVRLSSLWIQSTERFEKKLTLNVLLGIFLAIENQVLNCNSRWEDFTPLVSDIFIRLRKLVDSSAGQRSDFTSEIIGCLIGSPLLTVHSNDLTISLCGKIGWWDLALSLTQKTSSAHISSVIKRFEASAKVSNGTPLSDEQIAELTRTAVLAIVNSPILQIDAELRQKLTDFSRLTRLLDPHQNVFSLQSTENDENIDSDEHEQPTTDWSGQSIVDRPVARWGAVLDAELSARLKNHPSNTEEQLNSEDFLIESMKTATHVEKRWVVRSLASKNSDNSIKALLYLGLQHIDAEFVAHTIKELLPSPHPRAQQALIRCVGRNAISDELKLNILDEISIHNPTEILQELRTLEILRLPQHIDDAVRDAVGRVAALIDESDNLNSESSLSKNVIALDGFDVDSTIRTLLPNHEQLNVDARSALRTAEMILVQSRSWTQGGMDLSPIVNMHCKSVELVLRECFEPYTDALLRRGQLSRKLDVLGYSRPIPEKMQVFEDTLANLPVIKTIPYFSKFKLRKMLRGICLYRPGKRFTLDGPKAFALFFLVASRQSCPFGLENTMNLGFQTDKDLFEYIKLIHSLQDSRNRAVHEGLTWEAKDDIESMRSQAFKTIEISLKIKKNLMQIEGVKPIELNLGLGA